MGTLVQWKVKIKQVAFKEISRTKLTKDPICSLSVSGNGKLIVVGDSKGFVQLLNVNLVTSDVEILGTTGKNVHSLAITGVDFVKLKIINMYQLHVHQILHRLYCHLMKIFKMF